MMIPRRGSTRRSPTSGPGPSTPAPTSHGPTTASSSSRRPLGASSGATPCPLAGPARRWSRAARRRWGAAQSRWTAPHYWAVPAPLTGQAEQSNSRPRSLAPPGRTRGSSRRALSSRPTRYSVRTWPGRSSRAQSCRARRAPRLKRRSPAVGSPDRISSGSIGIRRRSCTGSTTRRSPHISSRLPERCNRARSI